MTRKKQKPLKSTCSYCGVGCGLLVDTDHQGHLTVKGDPDHPVNKGMLCSKGMNLHYTMQDKSDRLLFPQMRWSRNHPLERVSWDAAMQRAAAVFTSIIKQHGPDSVGFYVSGQCLTEEYYLANKLVKGFIGTNNIDTNSRLCMSSAVAGYMKTLGEDSVPISYEDIELADCFFIAGANPAWCHPILFRRIEAHKEKNPDVKIIVVDPRKTESAAMADLHLQILPGTDVYLYEAIARILIEEGEIDYDFISHHLEGYEDFKTSVFKNSVTRAAEICEIPESQIRQAARYIAQSNGFLTLWAMGLNQSSIGTNKNLALISLNLITGKIGKPGSGPFSLTGQPNAMGGREVGGLSSMLAAHRSYANPEHRKLVADFWNVKNVSSTPGLTATEMMEALERGDLKAIWIVCTNPMVSLPDSTRAEAALKKARFVVVQDISKNADTITFADLVLPAAGHFEKAGTMTNSERRISYLHPIVDPPGEALPDSDILTRFAKAMGYSGFDYATLAQVFDEHAALTKNTNLDISGLSHERLIAEGTFQWPVPTPLSKGTSRLFTDAVFFTENRKAKLHPISDAANTSTMPTPDYPLILTTGRIRDQWHTMTKTGKVNKLKQHISKPFLEIHPLDALIRGINQDDIVCIENEQGKVQVSAKLTEDIRKGVVFLPMHWGKLVGGDHARANNVTSNRVDPISKEPDFKFAAVQVTRYKKQKEKIIVVGAGAASFRFIHTYRSLNKSDDIDIFSKEKDPFYNRVLLPEYVNDKYNWSELEKFEHGEMQALNVNLHLDNEIISINREQKYVTDRKGEIHRYDRLVLATGSRAFVPKEVPVHLPGVFTIRTRQDADNLKKYLRKDGRILIVGGGLLGLELAASLDDIGIHISIVQVSSRLMERQLDLLSGELLLECIEEKGMDVYLSDQVQTVTQDADTNKLIALLQSGKELEVDAIVYAIGTRPNIEFITESGIDTSRGVVVNDYLQTSDPFIFAMGEIAEHQGRLMGITAAAEKQAEVVAHFMNGDFQSIYSGTTPMNILKFSDLDLCTLGISELPLNTEGYEEILFIDKSRRYYKKCIVKNDRLVGAVLVGDKSEFAEFKILIEDRIELSEKRMQLLRSGEKSEPVLGKLVCSCNQVGDGNIKNYITAGATTLPGVCKASGAGLGCGSCKPEIQRIIKESMEPVADYSPA